jgi:phosphoribosylformimino-5-aminoimidazole carboxamide ribotide isomerase
MRVIGVVDLLDGRAVHGRAGHRDRYAPVRAAAGIACGEGDPLALARAYTHALGVRELYAADLDAILGRGRQRAVVTALARWAPSLWLDAAVTTVAEAEDALTLGVARVVVGLETLPTFAALDAICAAIGGERVAFSLDLRAGVPLGAASAGDPTDVLAVAARAAEAGVGTVIVLDLARVGMGSGVDAALLGHVRAVAPHVELFAGGGVRGVADLEQLAAIGCDGALVATALHDGRLGTAELAVMRGLGCRRMTPPQA